MFNKPSLNDNNTSWLVSGRVGKESGVEMVHEVAGRIAILHISGENHRDVDWENRVHDAVQQVQIAKNPNDPNEVSNILQEKLGGAPKGFLVLVRYDYEARIDSLSDVVYEREVCRPDPNNVFVSFFGKLLDSGERCTKWVFVLGKNWIQAIFYPLCDYGPLNRIFKIITKVEDLTFVLNHHNTIILVLIIIINENKKFIKLKVKLINFRLTTFNDFYICYYDREKLMDFYMVIFIYYLPLWYF